MFACDLLFVVVLSTMLVPSGGHFDVSRAHNTLHLDVLITTAGATLVISSAVVYGICCCYRKKKLRRNGDAESQ